MQIRSITFLFAILFQFFLISFFFCGVAYADEEQHLNKLQASINLLKNHQGDILFPDVFGKLTGEIDAFRKRSSSADFAKTDAEFIQLINDLQSWVATARRTQDHLVNLLDIRQRAVMVEADAFAKAPFGKAEYYLALAAADDLRNARESLIKNTRQAKNFYLKSEHQAIRNHVLGEAKILIQEALALQADRYTPVTLQRTRQLFETVESLVKAKTPNHRRLSTTSRELRQSALHLLQLVSTIHPIYQNEQTAETVFLDTDSSLASLGKSLGTKSPGEKNLQETLSELKTAAAHLRRENEQLRAHSEMLAIARQELENELARYRTIAAGSSYIRKKVERLKISHGDIISVGSEFLTVALDDFRFEPMGSDIPTTLKNRLLDIVEILHEFPGNPVSLQYHQLSSGSNVFNQNLANRRLDNIKSFIASKYISIPPPPLQATAQVSNADLAPLGSSSYLEIVIDLKTYLGFGESNPIKSE